MQNSSMLVSVFFFSLCAFAIFVSFYVLGLGLRNKLNQLFFGVGYCFILWALGCSIANSTEERSIVILWLRLAEISWGFCYSVLLHFVLQFTRSPVLKKWWTYFLVYGPATASTVLFFARPLVSPTPYGLSPTLLGWVITGNLTISSLWFMIYTLLYAVLCVLVLRRYVKRQAASPVRSSARVITQSLVILVAGTVLYLVMNIALPFLIPQSTPLLMLFPIGSIFYCVLRYRLMDSRNPEDKRLILDEKMHTRLFDYLGLMYLGGSFLYFMIQYYIYRTLAVSDIISFSALMLLFGLAIWISSRLRFSDSLKEYIALAVICISIPVITLHFADKGAMAIWPFPFMFLFIALLYEKKDALISVTVSAIISQIALWTFAPAGSVTIKPDHYLIRMLIFLIGFIVALFINKVYVSRLRQSRAQIQLQKLFFELSSELVSSSLYNIREKIEHTLSSLGMFFHLEQAYMLLALGGETVVNSVLQWNKDGVSSAESKYLGMDIEEAKNIHGRMENEHAAAMFPVSVNQISFGVLVMLCTDKNTCTEENRAAMRIIANMLGDALSKAESERAINEMAYYDHLTNLPNRLSFNSRVEQAIQMVSRRNRQFAVLFLDLDSFKNVNDTMGHESGDLLLKLISRQLISSLRPKDTVSRFGGDEFLVLINDLVSLNDLPLIADRIMNLFRTPFCLDGQEFNITASAGISVYPADGTTADALVKNADIAMYQAKAKGKNQYVICSASLKQEVTDRLNLTNNLYRALDRQELMLYYQPQIDVKSGAIIGLEALLRWKHPELGMVPPYSFIPLAEHTGLINPIGEWVLHTACAQSVRWQEMGLPAVRMAVNISAIQFSNPAFAQQVARVLQQTALNPACLELELTESAALQNVEHTMHALSGLKDLGISISIDDFGTEYSSLSRLKLLPIDRIKMDMQFVHSIGGTSKDQAVTKIIISLAKNLGLKVIAEGVETKQQLDFLAQRMCDEVQGYYYFHPMPAEEVEAVLRERGAIEPTPDYSGL